MKKNWSRIGVVCILLGLNLNGFPHQPSRARGAIFFMNYCSGCHGLQYLSWSKMNEDLHLAEMQSLRMTHSILTIPDLSVIWPKVAMSSKDASMWFGKPPPDLSLIYRQRGSAWLHAYLQGFYVDHHRPFGTSNQVFPNVNMPNILETAQADLGPQAFASLVSDIVYFLEYVADPSVVIRYRFGMMVLSFLILFCLLFWWQISKMNPNKSEEMVE